MLQGTDSVEVENLGGLEVSTLAIARRVGFLAYPVLVEQALHYLVGLSDTLLTGRYLTQDHLAAVTVSTYLLWFLSNIMTIVSVGATAIVARMIGKKEPEAASRICQQAVMMGLILGTITFVVGWISASNVVTLLNLQGTAAREAANFLRIVLAATPMLACTAVGVACLRGAGDTRTGMWVMILVNAINVALSWSFVRGFGPLPSLGLSGVALGTAIGEGVGGLVILLILIRGRSGLHLSLQQLRPAWPEIRRILRISLPAAGESLTNISSQLWFLSLINKLGPTATAAHGVAIRCESLSFLTIAAFSVPASTLTGQYLGAGRPDLAARAARMSWALGMAVLSLLGVVIYTQAGGMFWLFTGGRQPDVTSLGVPVLRVIAFAMPALATINVLPAALRGAGDTRWPWFFVMLGYLGVRIPLTYYLTRPSELGGMGLGLYGAWLAMFADLSVRALLVAGRFFQGGWREARV